MDRYERPHVGARDLLGRGRGHQHPVCTARTASPRTVLLEGLVYGTHVPASRASEEARRRWTTDFRAAAAWKAMPAITDQGEPLDLADIRNSLKSADVARTAGVVRNRQRLSG